tara:strand:+ start:369 stop:518 length:150 start_codon:yes stop_codon:yes gene_type:complete
MRIKYVGFLGKKERNIYFNYKHPREEFFGSKKNQFIDKVQYFALIFSNG